MAKDWTAKTLIGNADSGQRKEKAEQANVDNAQ